jgi:fatty acid desaturase
MFFLIGISLNKLFFPVHDCIHFSLFPSKRENQFWGVIVSSFLGTTFEAISSQHFDHHKNFGSPLDPGASDYYVRFNTKLELITFIMSPLFGSIFFNKMFLYLKRPIRLMDVKTNISFKQIALTTCLSMWQFGTIIFFQSITAFILTDGFNHSELWRYPVFGLLPAFTVFLFLNRLRMFLEHGSIDYAVSDYLVNKNPMTRTIYSSIFEKIFICGSNFNFHHEHHLFPGVPGCQLKRLHNELIKFNYDPQHIRNSYAEALLELWCNLEPRHQ